ncbi:TadE family type IV pilus minor pilin [Actinopolyspora sp. H202]|uniref:TadE family type IV pilus minor pilin n=1 Tax=Actinopolyspora sp. H202 TaxID=1500456 RepID=UPI003EE638DC
MSVRDAEPDSASDTGSVTVEAALGICSVVAVFLLVLGAITAVFLQLRCTDAAVEAARLRARGDVARAERAVERVAPENARQHTTVANGYVTVTVGVRPLGEVLPIRLRARAHAALEPGVAGAGTPR